MNRRQWESRDGVASVCCEAPVSALSGGVTCSSCGQSSEVLPLPEDWRSILWLNLEKEAKVFRQINARTEAKKRS